MKIVKVYRPDCGDEFVAYKELQGLLDEVREFFVGNGVGDELRLLKVEMTKEEYNKLPEFTGW